MELNGEDDENDDDDDEEEEEDVGCAVLVCGKERLSFRCRSSFLVRMIELLAAKEGRTRVLYYYSCVLCQWWCCIRMPAAEQKPKATMRSVDRDPPWWRCVL